MTVLAFLIVVCCLPFLLSGITGRIKAVAAGRKGPPLLQSLFDFIKLMRKGEVVSRTTSLVFKVAPALGLAAVIGAGLFTPLATGQAVISFQGDFIVFAYLLALGKFITIAAALDTGSSFEGMGASREGSFSVLVEPGFFLLLGTLSLLTGRTSFQALLAGFSGSVSLSIIVTTLTALALFLLILIEGGRVPVDDPATHLELTMIHEVMVLDNSGPDLAFIQWARGLKNTLFASLLANLFLPLLPGAFLRMAAYFLILAAVAVAVGLVESVLARLRLTHVPQFVFLITSLALIVLFTAVFSLSGGLR